MTKLSDAELSTLIAKQAGQVLLQLRESYGVLDAGDKEQATAKYKEALTVEKIPESLQKAIQAKLDGIK